LTYLDLMIYRTISLLSLGCFCGSALGRSSFGLWATTVAAIGMIIGGIGEAHHRAKHRASDSSVASSKESRRIEDVR
jgi:hypothetical protein